MANPDQVRELKEFTDTVKLYRRETITAAAIHKAIVDVFNPFAPENCDYLDEAGFAAPESTDELEAVPTQEPELITA